MTTTATETMPRAEDDCLRDAQRVAASRVAEGLRQLADFIEEHPECDVRFVLWSFNLFPGDLAAVARAGYGWLQKKAKGDWYCLVKHFGPVSLEFNKKREEVCRRVVKEVKVIPAEPERTVTMPATPERRVEVVEWECPDSILAAG